MKLVITRRANTYQPSGKIGNFVTIDPGLGGTGWALWSRESFSRLVPPHSSGSIELPSSMDDWPWQRRATQLAGLLWQVLSCRAVGELYIEEPAFHESGHGIAAARSGDLIKLAVTAGILVGAGCGAGNPPLTPIMVPISSWKGSVSKDIIAQRVMKRLPNWKPSTKTTHEMDAVGIGLFVKGHL